MGSLQWVLTGGTGWDRVGPGGTSLFALQRSLHPSLQVPGPGLQGSSLCTFQRFATHYTSRCTAWSLLGGGVGPGLKGKGGIMAGAQATMVGGRTLPVPHTRSGLGPPLPMRCPTYAQGTPLILAGPFPRSKCRATH
jgi:hypothetical protein